MALKPLAGREDLEAFWRVITPTEAARVDSLLLISSNRLRLIAEDQGINIDEKVAASEVYKSNVQWVVMESVKRALQTPQDTPPVESYGMTAGPYSENYKLSNPAGDLYFKKSELSDLGLYGKQKLSSIITTREDLYS